MDASQASPPAASPQDKVHVLFHENYTVKNDDGATYQADQVYEMSPASAELFTHWCDCEIVDPLSSQVPPQPVNPATADPALATKVQAALDRNAKAKATSARIAKPSRSDSTNWKQGTALHPLPMARDRAGACSGLGPRGERFKHGR